jgi:hypothetical protein
MVEGEICLLNLDVHGHRWQRSSPSPSAKGEEFSQDDHNEQWLAAPMTAAADGGYEARDHSWAMTTYGGAIVVEAPYEAMCLTDSSRLKLTKWKNNDIQECGH